MHPLRRDIVHTLRLVAGHAAVGIVLIGSVSLLWSLLQGINSTTLSGTDEVQYLYRFWPTFRTASWLIWLWFVARTLTSVIALFSYRAALARGEAAQAYALDE
jgi:hypothetical protein